MHYLSGPLEVTHPGTDFVFSIEVGQGSKQIVHTSDDLEASVRHLLEKSTVPAFRLALEDLQKLGRDTDWDWNLIARNSVE